MKEVRFKRVDIWTQYLQTLISFWQVETVNIITETFGQFHKHFMGITDSLTKYYIPGNTKGGSITALLTSCLTGLE